MKSDSNFPQINFSETKDSPAPEKLMTIRVEQLRLRAFIGYQDWEREKLQDVVLSYSFKYSAARAAVKDQVDYAVNYKTLTKQIIQLVDRKSFDLIETIAEKIYQNIENFHDEIQQIEVCVEKPHALRFADNVLVKISHADRYQLALISLGSNIQPEKNFKSALNYLTEYGIIVDRTEFIQTKPLKFTDQPDFLNGAVLIHTTLPKKILQLKLKQIEALLGRVRSENKNAPREIDLDVVTYNNTILDPEELHELPFLKDFIRELQPEIVMND